MEKETRLRVKLTGDSKELVGTVLAGKGAVEDLGKTAKTESDKGAAGVRGLSAEFLQLQDTLDPTVANTRRLAAATDLLDRELKQGNITVERHAQLLQMANTRYRQARGGMMNMRMASQQLGYQIQDMAVQMQMGVNPIMALTQQGSQLAGVMGPGGALFGAVLAIGGAIAGGLVSSLSQASEEMDKLSERADDLISDTLTAQIHQTKRDLDSMKLELQQFATEFEKAAGVRDRAFMEPNLWGLTPDEIAAKQDEANKVYEEARKNYLSAGEAVANLSNRLESLQDQQTGNADTSRDQARAARDQQAALQALLDSLFPAEAATRQYHESVDLLERAIVQFPHNAELYRRALDTLHAAHRTTQISLGDLRLDIEGFSGVLTDNLDLSTAFIEAHMKAYYQRMDDAYQTHQDRIAVATQVTSYAFENAWVSALKNGEDMWKSFADTVIDQILRIQYQMTIGKGIEQFFQGMFSNIFPGPAAPGGPHASTAGGDFGGITVPPTGLDRGGINLDLSLRPTASRAAPEPAASVIINQVNDFSSVSSADEARIQQMLDDNSRQTEARIYQHINRGGAAARTVGRR